MHWILKTDNLANLSRFSHDDFAEVVITISDIAVADFREWLANAKIAREKIRLSLPTICREPEVADLLTKVRALQDEGFSRWEIAQLGHLSWMKPDANIVADWTLYTLNTSAMDFLRSKNITRFTASPEDDRQNLSALLAKFAAQLQIIIYQNTPLFIGEGCPQAVNAPTNCAACQKNFPLQNARQQEYVALVKNCRTTIISQQPFCLSQAINELASYGLQYARVDFTHQVLVNADDIYNLWQKIKRGENIASTHNGNYLRGLQ